MGKMKEKFMEINYPMGDLDLEREYLIDDMIAREREYYEYLQVKSSPEMNEIPNTKPNTKIELGNATNNQPTTRITVQADYQETGDYSNPPGEELRF